MRGAFHGKKGKGITIKTTKSHTALEDYIKKSVPEEQQDNIFRTLKKSTCCQNSDQIDACAGCATNCALYHKNGADAGIEILKTKKAVAKKPKAKKPTQSFKPTVKRTEKPLPGLATFKLRR